MMMKRTMMALAAVPAVLLAGGGVAVAQTTGVPAGTAVVQQAATHHGSDACRGHQAAPVVKVAARHDRDNKTCDGTRDRDRDRDYTVYQQAAR